MKYKYDEVHCSQCGKAQGPGNHGFSHCRDHRTEAAKKRHHERGAQAAKEVAKSKKLHERRIIPVAQPTDNQKAVLAKIKAAATPRLAAADVSENPNLAAARDMLVKLGLIDLNDEGAFVTDKGEEVMLNQNLVTQGGELTNMGQEAAHGKEAAAQMPDPGSEDDFDFDLDADLGGDEELDAEVDLSDDKGEVGLELDMGESFRLLNALRDKAITESLEHVPSDLVQQLTPTERAQLKAVVDGASLYKFEDLYRKLFDYFVDKMPYGTAKARTGDPDQWIEDRVRGDVGDQDLGSMADAAELRMEDR